MVFVIRFTDETLRDLDSIAEYISFDSPLRAEKYVNDLVEKIQTLKVMPNCCPLAPENRRVGVELRHFIHGSYRVLYTIKGKEIVILRIVHGARVKVQVQ